MELHSKIPDGLVLGVLVSLILVIALSAPASAVEFCGPDSTDSSASDTIKDMFLILQILGPVFGILFYSGLLVADAASLDSDRQDKRRKVIIYGFSVPVSIVLLQQIAQQLVDQDISCFFPG